MMGDLNFDSDEVKDALDCLLSGCGCYETVLLKF